jgi:hypothetical protein
MYFNPYYTKFKFNLPVDFHDLIKWCHLSNINTIQHAATWHGPLKGTMGW